MLQRHICRAVGHKYGNDDHCRFLFPHEIVETSYFDSETNSVALMCRDGNVNYFNPYLLVFCRHKHDFKCILSGKGAKAATFYISDYIMKMDFKTYEVLSLLSRAVARIPDSTSALRTAQKHFCTSVYLNLVANNRFTRNRLRGIYKALMIAYRPIELFRYCLLSCWHTSKKILCCRIEK